MDQSSSARRNSSMLIACVATVCVLSLIINELRRSPSFIGQDNSAQIVSSSINATRNETLEQPPSAPDADEEAVQAAVRLIHETPLPLVEREQQMLELALSGTDVAHKTLIALANTIDNSGVHILALRALGHTADPRFISETAEILLRKFKDQDVRVVAAAIASYGCLLDDNAISTLTKNLRYFRHQKPGNGRTLPVRAALVETLAAIATPQAIEVLVAELKWVRMGLNEGLLEHGESLISALAQVDFPHTRAAVADYVKQLEKKSHSENLKDPTEQKAFRQKTAKARRITGVLCCNDCEAAPEEEVQ
jgi:hypothetical protein